jgi:ATP adenylyltransferase
MERFEPGTLRERVEEAHGRAHRSGALSPIATRSAFIEDGGVRFLVRILERVEKKRESKERGGNPFLPYEEELFIAGVSETHLALLNKFNVLNRHFLVVTRRFEEQESLLGEEDFEAMRSVMRELDCIGFYNAGPAGGASQSHKHLQFVTAPLSNGPGRCPMEVYLTPSRWRELPFACHFSPLDDLGARPVGYAAAAMRDRYQEALAAVGRPDDPRAYNLLATSEWMLLVPRRRGSWESISVNALGFAGAMLVNDEEDLERLRRKGPMSVLSEVTSGASI